MWYDETVRLQLQGASSDDIFRKGCQKGIMLRTSAEPESKSQCHSVLEVGRDLTRSPGPPPVDEQQMIEKLLRTKSRLPNVQTKCVALKLNAKSPLKEEANRIYIN